MAIALSVLMVSLYLLSWLFVALSIADTLKWPDEAWRHIGDTRRAWIVFQVLSIPFAGVGSFLYMLRVRPKLVGLAGRNGC